MNYERFSRKQLLTLLWWKQAELNKYDGLICDGSVRSGKTVAMSVGFLLWAMSTFDGCKFALCGKTIEALRRNVVSLIPGLMDGIMRVQERRSDNTMTVWGFGHVNTFYLFGGRDESSYTLIQGMTLAGVLFDEVALMPRSFVEQALARCSISGSRYWFNCNPEGPSHWFYREWILKAEAHNALHLHFTMADNLALDPAVRARYETMYTGVFYQRYILGLWVAAEGIIYRPFADSIAAGDRRFYWPPDQPLRLWRVQIGVDFGGNGSKHAFVATGILPGYEGVVGLASQRVDAQGQDATALCQAFLAFCQAVFAKWGEIHAVYCDNAEQVLIQSLRSALRASSFAWLAGRVHNARKAPILDRIRLTSLLMGGGRFFVLPAAQTLTDALATALWSGKHPGQDERLDDGTTDIDTLDAFEYTIEREYRSLLRMNA